MSRGSFYDNTNEEELIASTQTNSTNAASSATAAAASAASAAASYDAFDDRYLGTKSSDPTTDNDSNTLVDGALYFNTSNNVMMVYDLGNTTWNRTTPTSSDQTKINTVSGIQANVTTVAGISSDVTTVAGISSDIAAVEDIKANVTSVAGIASNVTSVAGNATNINAAVSNATNINAAGTHATTASTKATEAAASATTASTKATEAAASATTASAKATLTAADAVATAADVVSSAANAASAAATYDNFDDRYLGSKSSAPTVDNDGNSLVVGALYFDSTAAVMKVNTASGWVNTSSATLATMERFVFTATANQTEFTGADAGGDTLASVVGAEIVTLSGVVLEVTADYTVTTSKVTLNSGAAVNDELNVYAFGNFEIANHYTKAAADALYDAKASLSGAAFTGAITTNSTIDGRDVAADGVLATNALPKSGGAMTGAITTNSTFDGRDVAADGVTADAALPKTGGAMTGAITTNSTFDGRDVGTDGTKLDGIEANATADQTNAEIRAAVEAASDSNVFTDADHSKLNAIEASATADQTNAEIRAAVEAASDSNVFTDADHSKLNAIEASADVTDATNVTAAGALMDSEVTNLAAVKAFDASDYATAAQGTLATNAMPKSGGAFTGAVTTNSTIDGVDIATRDGVLTTTTTTANAALPKAGGTMSGTLAAASVTVAGNAVGTLTTDNDGSFSMSASNNFKCTPSGNFALTFTNIVAQAGNILLVNSGGHTVTAHANTKIDAKFLSTVSTAGTYLLAYFSDGTNVYMTNSAIYT